MSRTQPNTLELALPEGDTALVSLHGGQVLSWRTADGREQLYCAASVRETLASGWPGRALRAGVPVCFPQFAGRGPLPKHGFARTSAWRLAGACDPCDNSRYGNAAVTLALCDSEDSRAAWPYAFLLALTVTLGPGLLRLDCVVKNTGSAPYTFTAALHTYLRCDDVHRVRLVGLDGCPYEDALDDNRTRMQPEEALRVAGEIDRVYPAAPATLCLTADETAGDSTPEMMLRQYGFEDWVVWNPGPAKAAALTDMPQADWQHMLCVESGQIAKPVHLAPDASWRAGVSLKAVAPMYREAQA